jgi:hypothetical protein
MNSGRARLQKDPNVNTKLQRLHLLNSMVRPTDVPSRGLSWAMAPTPPPITRQKIQWRGLRRTSRRVWWPCSLMGRGSCRLSLANSWAFREPRPTNH